MTEPTIRTGTTTPEVDNTLTGDPSGPTVQAKYVIGGAGNSTTTIVNEGPAAVRALFAVPAPPDGFIGRADQLHEVLGRLAPLDTDAAQAPQGQGAVVVSALAGMGGIGKTALALQAASVAAGRGWFCAQLFVDLHSYTPTSYAIEAATALDALLRQVGVDPDDIPADLGERSAFYRSALHALTVADARRRPVLVVADNAHTLNQIEPLLPGPGGHRLLVTSRERLTINGHQPLTLDTLDRGEAVDLLTIRLGAADPRCGDEDGLVALAERCGYLPLALKIAAALLARAPALPPGRLAQRLADTSRFSDGRDDLAAVFNASLTHLPPDHVRVLALLGANPGPDISTSAAAVLTDLGAEAIEPVLEELAAAHLLTAHPADRWSMHDLLTDHARIIPDQGDDVKHPGPRELALRRLLEHYTSLARAADAHLRSLTGDTPPTAFGDQREALAWLEAEHDNLIAAVQAAHTHGHSSTAIGLPGALSVYLGRQRRFSDAITVHTLAQETAQRIGDTHGEAMAWSGLGLAQAGVGQAEEAIDAHTRARKTFNQLGDMHGEAMAWHSLGLAQAGVGQTREAINALIHARTLYQQTADPHNEAAAWDDFGTVLRQVGHFEEAIDAHTRAREAFNQLGDTHSEAAAWSNLGLAQAGMGQARGAIDALIRARTLYQQTADTQGEAIAWNSLGMALRQVGHFKEAIDAHTHARDTAQRSRDIQNTAHAWGNLGTALQQVGHFEEAIDAHTRAREAFNQLGDTHSEAAAW
ncbi:tetratricopeptide repeat protein, partial [Nocardiopsis aegyptia]|uniref:tetratricopeptide repeat protein n=1 Tax=Nocardiopsis aegyptia TaxID=220378 RepID=UPI0036728EC2